VIAQVKPSCCNTLHLGSSIHVRSRPMRALATFAVLLWSTCAFAQKPPAGWRFPTEADMKGNWLEYRELFPKPYHTRADFNGDGILDDAWILISRDGTGSGAFVFLSRKQGGFSTITIFSDDRSPAQGYAVAAVPPGKHSTFCGRVGECEKGEPKSVTLLYAGFELHTLGTAAGLYYWNRKTRSFSSVTTAD